MPDTTNVQHLDELINYIVKDNLLEPEQKAEFRLFVLEGEADQTFLAQLDSDDRLQQAVEIALAWQDKLLESKATGKGTSMISAEQAQQAAKTIEWIDPITSIGVGYDEDYGGFCVRVGVERPLVEGESLPSNINGVAVLLHVTGKIVALSDNPRSADVEQES